MSNNPQNLSPFNKTQPPNIDEVRVLKFLATKFPTDINNLRQLSTKIRELSQSSRSQVFGKALSDLTGRFTLIELQKIIIELVQENEENEESHHNNTKPIGRIRTPILFEQNLKRSAGGIMAAFQNLKNTRSNPDQTESVDTQSSETTEPHSPKIILPKQKDLNAGEFSLHKK
jgi:hypothetical protein